MATPLTKEKEIEELLKKCKSSIERERYSAYAKIADIYSLDSADEEEFEMPPITCFAAIV